MTRRAARRRCCTRRPAPRPSRAATTARAGRWWVPRGRRARRRRASTATRPLACGPQHPNASPASPSRRAPDRSPSRRCPRGVYRSHGGTRASESHNETVADLGEATATPSGPRHGHARPSSTSSRPPGPSRHRPFSYSPTAGSWDLDASVAQSWPYWPESAANGGEGILVRHVMGHISGVSGRDQPVSLTGGIGAAGEGASQPTVGRSAPGTRRAWRPRGQDSSRSSSPSRCVSVRKSSSGERKTV